MPQMVQPPGYEVLSQLHESARTVVFRAIRNKDGLPVILKLLVSSSATPHAVSRYHHEHEIIRSLDAGSIIKTYGLESLDQTVLLVLEDVGGTDLHTLLKSWGRVGSEAFPVKDFYSLTRKIVDGVAALHSAGIIHKDVCPSNIVLNPASGALRIIDLDSATTLGRETPLVKNPRALEATLRYIAPEQTGRLNRTVDYRADFYSLGATLYELLTGSPAFDSDDPMELIHAHLARNAVAPHLLNLNVPPVLSAIVEKLMAKAPEERYQSARGLLHDLAECERCGEGREGLRLFPLGTRDRAERFMIPEKLYGRTKEVEALLAAFERAAKGSSELVTVKGLAGIGKTAVVSEVNKSIVREHGSFVQGKFDQLNRGIPLSAFLQALRELVGQAREGSSAELRALKENILSRLGESGGLLIEVIPELEHIIGRQPPVAELSGSAAENRFNFLFQSFIGCFCTAGRPLVMFLDDMQWADMASLKLMQLLMSPPRRGYLMLIGAYRENEVLPAHPLQMTLEEITKAGVSLTPIAVPPLGENDVNQLIADTLNCSAERARPLAAHVYQKTRGNPFFGNQFLKALHDEGLIVFNAEIGSWECDIGEVGALSRTDDVVEFMAQQLRKLPEATLGLLRLAACIGGSFELGTLAIVSEKSQVQTAADIWPALQAGLVLPQGSVYRFYRGGAAGDNPFLDASAAPAYRFLHDHAQQAAYSLIPAAERKVTHLRIGQLLDTAATEAQREERLFEIVGQLNRGIDLLTEPSRLRSLAELNLRAGRKARMATANPAAREYFACGRQLLPPASWRDDYVLTLSLYTASVEAAYLNGAFHEMERLADVVIAEARSLPDTVRVYEVRIEALAVQNRMRDAVRLGLQVLRTVGVTFPGDPTQADFLAALEQTRTAYRQRGIESLIELPLMSDPLQMAVMRIMVSISPPAFLSIQTLYSLLILEQVRLSIAHGNLPASAFAYASLGLILCGGAGEIDDGHAFGNLAIRLVTRMNAREWECKVPSIVASFVTHWKDHLRQTLAPLRSAYYVGMEIGDLQYAGYSAILYAGYAYYGGIEKDLPGLREEIIALSDSAFRMRQVTVFQYFQMLQQAVHDLIEGRESPTELEGAFYSEREMMPRHEEAKDWNGLFYVHFNKLLLNYLFAEHRQAVQDALHVEAYRKEIAGFPYLPIIHLYDSLARLALFREKPGSASEELVARIDANQVGLRTWAGFAPMNCLHKLDLVEAERHRTFGPRTEAMAEYDRAIAEAREAGYSREEALANELAAGFYLEWGKETIARAYMAEARAGYARWGARAKVAQLERRYPALLPAQPDAGRDGALRDSRESGMQPVSSLVDLSTVIKASQALAREIDLGRLLGQLLRIAIENAGAQKGSLLLEQQGGWVVAAQWDSAKGGIARRDSVELRRAKGVTAGVVLAVARSRRSLVLGDAAGAGDFTQDPHIVDEGVRSVICVPLLNQGRISGILYLENNLVRNAFSAERLELLELLSTQMALSLDNALLYQNAQREIEDRRRAEEALRESETRFRTIYESLYNAIILLDVAKGTITDVNNACCAMYGYTREELLNLSIGELSPEAQPRSLGEMVGAIKKIAARGQGASEWKAKGKGGRQFWVEVNVREVLIDGRNHLLMVIRDITDRKRAQEALRKKTEELDRYFTFSLDLLFIADHHGVYVKLNPEWEKVLGYPLSEILGRQYIELVHPEDKERTLVTLALARQESVLGFVNRYRCRDGSYRWLEWNSLPDGDMIYGVARDITLRKKAEEEIRLVNEHLEARVQERTAQLAAANRELESFSYTVSHDLRAPLRAIDGYARMLENDYGPSLDQGGQRLTGIIRANARRMDELINDLLSFSRLGRAEMRSVTIDMKSLVHSIFEELRTLEDRPGLEVHVGDLPPASGDPTMMRQVWLNLISNALKFTSKRARALIEVRGERGGEEVTYSVRDNGSGFEMKYVDKLFGVFQRLHSDREFEGTGVGLAIVKRVVQRHGGRVWAEAEPDIGATFSFSLPAAAAIDPIP